MSHLANGIHGVEYLADGAWQPAQMNGDMGQSYVIGGTTAGGTDFQIRVRDASDTLINGGRVYRFSLPAACATQCSAGVHPGPLHDRDRHARDDPADTARHHTARHDTSGRPARRAPRRTRSPASGTAGYQADVTVRNTGTAPITGWQVSWTLPAGVRITQMWNAAPGTGAAR